MEITGEDESSVASRRLSRNFSEKISPVPSVSPQFSTTKISENSNTSVQEVRSNLDTILKTATRKHQFEGGDQTKNIQDAISKRVKQPDRPMRCGILQKLLTTKGLDDEDWKYIDRVYVYPVNSGAQDHKLYHNLLLALNSIHKISKDDIPFLQLASYQLAQVGFYFWDGAVLFLLMGKSIVGYMTPLAEMARVDVGTEDTGRSEMFDHANVAIIDVNQKVWYYNQQSQYTSFILPMEKERLNAYFDERHQADARESLLEMQEASVKLSADHLTNCDRHIANILSIATDNGKKSKRIFSRVNILPSNSESNKRK